MKARAPVIAGRRHDQDPTPNTLADGIAQDGIRPAPGGKFATADIDDIGPVLSRLNQGPRQVKLRASLASQALAAPGREKRVPAALDIPEPRPRRCFLPHAPRRSGSLPGFHGTWPGLA